MDNSKKYDKNSGLCGGPAREADLHFLDYYN